MIRGDIDGSVFGRMADRVRRMADPDLKPLAQEIREIVIAGLARVAQNGTDRNGRKLAPLAESTRRKPGHDGEPLRHGGSPAFLDTLRVDVANEGKGQISVNVYFGHQAAEITASGTRNQPPRDIFAPDDRTREGIRAAVREFGRKLLRGQA